MRKEKDNITVESAESEQSDFSFKFFKSCSASLKRFSIILFIINIFIVISAAIVGGVFLAVYVGLQIFLALILPLILVIAVLCIFARFISALIYGFAEIVEKSEK